VSSKNIIENNYKSRSESAYRRLNHCDHMTVVIWFHQERWKTEKKKKKWRNSWRTS